MSRRGWSTSNYFKLASGVAVGVPLSVSVWAKTSIIGAASSQYMFGLWNSAAGTTAQNQFSFGVAATTNFIFCQETDNASAGGAAMSSAAISANGLFHGLAVFSGNASRSVYLNGGNKGTDATAAGVGPVGINRTTIGTGLSTDATIAPFAPAGTGDIAEIAVWKTALIDTDAPRLATGIDARAVSREFLIAYWKLDGGGLKEVNLANRNADISVTGALSLSPQPPKIFMPRIPTLILPGLVA